MRTAVLRDVEYMMARSMPLLLTDASGTFSPSKRRQPTEVGARLIHSTRGGIRIDERVFKLLHVLRFTELALRKVIPACDRDLPFALRERYHLASLGKGGRIDFARTLATGSLVSNQAIYAEQFVDYNTPESEDIGRGLFQLWRDGNDALARMDDDLRYSNPLMAKLCIELSGRLTELHLAVKRRPQLWNGFCASSQRRQRRRLSRYRGNHRSVLNARRLKRYYAKRDTLAMHGDGARTQITITPDKVYEFWCFCEFTSRLFALGKYEVTQNSILRTGLDKPVFAFGEDHFVYYEHRRNYFCLDSGRRLALQKARPLRGPEWFVLRDSSVRDSIIIDCKYYKKKKAGMFDQITWYCQDYGAQTGVGFAACQPPYRLQRKRGLREEEKCIEQYRPGNRSLQQFDVYLVPHPNYENLNRRVIDRLIRLLGL